MPDRDIKIILASGSPRRAELLATIGMNFDVVPSTVDEWPYQGEPIADYTMSLARAKVGDVAARFSSGLVIGADTVVVAENELLGKPRDENDARRMLRLLSGRWHTVITGVVVRDIAAGSEATGHEVTRVSVTDLTDAEIDWYVATREPLDKAGAYGIQGRAAVFIDQIAGNYFNVMGLPLPLVYRLIRRMKDEG